jgi:hypothetical protein
MPSDSPHIHYSSDRYLPQHHYNSLICPVNLKPSQENSRLTEQTFAELCSQNYGNKEPLFILRAARKTLQNNGILVVYDTSQTPQIDRYVESLFCCAGFTLLNQQDNCFILQKRPLLTLSVPKTNLMVKEAETSEEFKLFSQFLLSQYPSTHNYLPEIDDLFTNQSAIFLAFPEDNPSEIIGVARYTHALPEYGYKLPLQLAILSERKYQGQHFPLSDKIAGKSLCLYQFGVTGYRAYQQLIRAIMMYKYDIASTQTSYTTYPKSNAKIGDLYKDGFGFKHTLFEGEKVCLKYGTFGDEWYLLEFDRSKIEENYRNPELMFKRKKIVAA